jgi:hypothetical protein
MADIIMLRIPVLWQPDGKLNYYILLLLKSVIIYIIYDTCG